MSGESAKAKVTKEDRTKELRNRFGDSAKAYWAKFTKEERSAEMRRRITKRYKTQKQNHTRNHNPTRKAKRHGTPPTQSTRKHTAHVEYLYGKVETILEYYARSNGVPFAALAQGVSGLLHDQAHGQGVGPRDRL